MESTLLFVGMYRPDKDLAVGTLDVCLFANFTDLSCSRQARGVGGLPSR